MPRLLALLIIALPCAGHTGDVKLSTEGWKLRFALQALQPRHVPPAGAGHLQAKRAPPRKDPCVWAAGVRHCPLPELPARLQ